MSKRQEKWQHKLSKRQQKLTKLLQICQRDKRRYRVTVKTDKKTRKMVEVTAHMSNRQEKVYKWQHKLPKR